MTINSSTAIHDVVLFVRKLLRENITDPLNRKDNIGFIMTAFPRRKTQYPLITIKNTGYNTQLMGMQSTTKWVNINLELQIYARDSKEADELTDSVVDILRLNQYTTNGTNNEGVYNFNINSIVPIVEEEGDNTIHRKVITGGYNLILSD